MLRWLAMLILTLSMVAGVIHVMKTPVLRPVIINMYANRPIIKPLTSIIDIGTVNTDDKVRQSFYIYNVGDKPLEIRQVEPSCGCTVAKLSRDSVPPGEFAQLDVILDTSLKIGHVRKRITITTNDPKTPSVDLFLTGTVMFAMKGHEKIEVKDPLVLFKGECATCHVDKGKGKTGKMLFVADCAMCHGVNADGNPEVAPSLLKGDFNDPAHAERIRQVIVHGSPRVPTMPPYDKASGGPLNADEINSLMTFLKYQSSLKKDGKLDQSMNDMDEASE